MAYELKDNSGNLFNNAKKTTEKHPDMTGTVMIDGVVFYVSAWHKTGKGGAYLSLAFEEKTETPAVIQPKTLYREPDDDLTPF